MVKLRICRFFAVGIKTKVFYLHPSDISSIGKRHNPFLPLSDHPVIIAPDRILPYLTTFPCFLRPFLINLYTKSQLSDQFYKSLNSCVKTFAGI